MLKNEPQMEKYCVVPPDKGGQLSSETPTDLPKIITSPPPYEGDTLYYLPLTVEHSLLVPWICPCCLN